MGHYGRMSAEPAESDYARLAGHVHRDAGRDRGRDERLPGRPAHGDDAAGGAPDPGPRDRGCRYEGVAC